MNLIKSPSQLIEAHLIEEDAYSHPASDQHYERVSTYLPSQVIQRIKTLEALKDAGFRYLVHTNSFIKQFKYHAGIEIPWAESHTNWSSIAILALIFLSPVFFAILLNDPVLLWFLSLSLAVSIPLFGIFLNIGIETGVVYIGDIPEFVLDNMETFTKVFPTTTFSVHSMQPLEVQVFTSVDPVMIARIGDEISVVIGVWNEENENILV